MKNMYAVKCLYKYNLYNQKNEFIKDLTPGFEERIILLKANSLEEAENKAEAYAKEYETEYTNVDNQILKVKLYEIIDIFAVFDTDEKDNIEVYSKMFNATEEEVENILDVMYPVDEE